MRLLRPENASKTLIHAQIAAGFFVYVLRYEHITKNKSDTLFFFLVFMVI